MNSSIVLTVDDFDCIWITLNNLLHDHSYYLCYSLQKLKLLKEMVYIDSYK